jgi:hypothetical protein
MPALEAGLCIGFFSGFFIAIILWNAFTKPKSPQNLKKHKQR